MTAVLLRMVRDGERRSPARGDDALVSAG
jgi:hypothetical protein